MKFVKVDEVPKTNRKNNSLIAEWEQFMGMNIKFAEVKLDGHEYKTVKSAINSFAMSIRRAGYPIDVVTRKGKIYLIRRDM